MIESVIAWSVRNPWLVIAGAIALAIGGVYALVHTPVDAIPDLSENQVIVFADWPGRSPKEVEDQVTYPLSVNLQGLAGVKAVRATSEFGFSMINVIFEDRTDYYFARQRVSEKLAIANSFLPSGVMPYLAPDTTALGQIYWYTVEGDNIEPQRLRAIQDWYVRYQLQGVQGVSEVASVGGFPQEYQIDVDPAKLRAYNVTLGEIYSAVARSNSAVGGRVLQKANSEYLIRSSGWITSTTDIERTVIKSDGGIPIYVGTVATVQLGPSMRRASLEKNGQEAVGGVVLMRYGENPLAVTKRVKEKIAQLTAGLPEGVRIVPFYERTELIERSLDTVTDALWQEIAIASVVIILILGHIRSAIIICITFPLAILASFILMRVFGIPSNIMSLSGLAISIGVLDDCAIVTVENASHELYKEYGDRPVEDDTTEFLLPSLQAVGRPIFFSVMITLISFIPVFALGGMEGRMFHPLAFTKSFAMAAVAILAITFVPALIPLMVKGRIYGEEESWIVRSVAEIYRPVLSFSLDHPLAIVAFTALIFIVGIVPAGIGWLIVGSLGFGLLACYWAILVDSPTARLPEANFMTTLFPFFRWFGFKERRVDPTLSPAGSWSRMTVGVAAMCVLIVATAWSQSGMKPLGTEFMPPLDEGTVLDMPVTIPRASITQVTDDLKARDRLLRMFPEVYLVVGKAGRAETPTDPAPPDMVETVVNLRAREHWPKREMRFRTAEWQTQAAVDALIRDGALPASLTREYQSSWGISWPVQIGVETPVANDQRDSLVNDATMFAIEKFDVRMRDQALQDFLSFEHLLAPQLTQVAVEESLRLLSTGEKLKRELSAEERTELESVFAARFGPLLVESPDIVTARKLAEALTKWLAEKEIVEARSDLLVLTQNDAERHARDLGEVFGYARPTFFSIVLAKVEQERHERWSAHVYDLNGQLLAQASSAYTWEVLVRLRAKATELKLWKGDATEERLTTIRKEVQPAFDESLVLWARSKDGLLKEMDTAVQVPGWGNIWTQPIINRIDMLATGVRTMIGVKVYGDDLTKIQRVSEEIATVLRGVQGAADVFPDQIVGEGYLEINIDREKAARYGVNIGDVQDVIETALGGKTITMTVEGRERFPVRVRYARAFREDEESVKNLLISSATSMPGGNAAMSTGPGMTGAPAMATPTAGTSTKKQLQIQLSQIAEVKIVSGPSMIKSEGGLLRSYVQLNVRDRDIVGFVDEARRAVDEKVKLPEGMYLEWSGQFEHQVRAKQTLMLIVPVVVITIFVLLYVTYYDFMDAVLMMFAVPGAVAGGILFQYLWGFNFSVAVWVGFIACFGLATETGVVMLVYLREAIDAKGGLENMTKEELRQAVMDGAVHRLRPKLLTEATTIIGLAPMLWATGTGSEIMRPMAAPVLGGLLVADEVIDLLLPVLFYHLRLWRWYQIHGDDDEEVAEPIPVPAPTPAHTTEALSSVNEP